jgi:hypothetical protein
LLLLIFLAFHRPPRRFENSELTAEYQQIISDDTQQFNDAFLQKTVSLTVSGPSLSQPRKPRV